MLTNASILLLACVLLLKPQFYHTTENAIIIQMLSVITFCYYSFFSGGVGRSYFFWGIIFLFVLFPLTILFKITACYPMVVGILCVFERRRSFPVRDNGKAALLLGVCFLFSFLLYQSHLGRYSLLNGDPNYTSLIFLTLILVAHYISNSPLLKVFSVLFVFFIVFMTESRTAVIAVLAYFICSKIKYKRFFSLSIFIFSIVSQYFSAYVFPRLISSVELGENRFFDLNDASNHERISIYKQAVDYIGEHFYFFLSRGVTDYLAVNLNATNIPHNWFVQSIIGFGLIFTLVYSIVMMFYIATTKHEHCYVLPFMCFFMIFGAFLSYYSLTSPLLVLCLMFPLISSSGFNIKRGV
ncbi:hypothetical protein C9E85_12590 [Plesiomonas shigelloides]|uniref:O-antigen ligase family protein n=1 Tax=Plesiomonas shigelloides TaxID=703 RepID=UPI000D5691D2|nr:O-antigen ligase family protein [Plesiomonas shigelloides]PVU65478.1 hypothetical protein C9E85_12590 [Plesiomonas shigelloides]